MDAYLKYFNSLKAGDVVLSEAEFNAAVAPARTATIVKITTHGGMTLRAHVEAVNVLNGCFTATWLMRLNLIENKFYFLSVNPEMIKTVEYING